MADNLAEQEQEELTSLDDTLAAALKDIESREETDEPEAAAETEQSEAEVQEPEKEPEKTAEPEKEQAETEAIEEAAETAEPEQPTGEIRRPPGSWSAKGKAEFAKLPEHIQDEVLKRENDFHNGLEQYKEKAQIGERMQQVVQPYEPLIRARNSTPEQTVQNMLQTAYMLEQGTPEQKQQMLVQVAQQFGIDLSGLSQGEQAKPDPYIQQLQQKIQQLEQGFQSQTMAAQQQSMSEAYSTIDQFRNEVDEQGNPKHLYFDDVRDQMADMIETAERSGRKLTIQDAYDAAVWSRPDIRTELLAQQQKADEERRKQEAKQKAAEARKRASVNVSTTGAHPGSETSQPGSIDETLRAKYQEIQARDD